MTYLSHSASIWTHWATLPRNSCLLRASAPSQVSPNLRRFSWLSLQFVLGRPGPLLDPGHSTCWWSTHHVMWPSQCSVLSVEFSILYRPFFALTTWWLHRVFLWSSWTPTECNLGELLLPPERKQMIISPAILTRPTLMLSVYSFWMMQEKRQNTKQSEYVKKGMLEEKCFE